MPKRFDNLNSRVVDDLKITLKKSSKVSIAAASFSIYAYEALKEKLVAVDEVRLFEKLKELKNNYDIKT